MTHPGQLLKSHQLYAGKELGQNFLSNPATADMIVAKTGIRDSDHVLEIGPGLGGLTIPLSKAARTVTAVEKDARLLPILENQLSEHGITNVKLVHHDVLTLDISSVAPNKKLVIVGNLPYNISSQIIFKLVKERGRIPQAFLMFQKELAQRIIASPGGRAYSRLAAVVQYAAGVSFVAEIGPAHFFPRPDVDSTILKFEFFQ